MKRKLLVGLLVAASGAYLLERLGRRWGATDAEVYRPLPSDTLVPHPMVESTHATTIHAAAEEVWPWLAQAGYHRGGWYTEARWYAWLERTLWHTTSPSVDRILPEFQQLAVGDIVPDGPPGTATFTVAELEPNRLLALYSTSHIALLAPAFLRKNPKVKIGGSWQSRQFSTTCQRRSIMVASITSSSETPVYACKRVASASWAGGVAGRPWRVAG